MQKKKYYDSSSYRCGSYPTAVFRAFGSQQEAVKGQLLPVTLLFRWQCLADMFNSMLDYSLALVRHSKQEISLLGGIDGGRPPFSIPHQVGIPHTPSSTVFIHGTKISLSFLFTLNRTYFYVSKWAGTYYIYF